MTAYSCTPNDGTNQLWITSVPVTRTRMIVSTGTTSGLSTSRSRVCPGFRSLVVRNDVAVEGKTALVGIFVASSTTGGR